MTLRIVAWQITPGRELSEAERREIAALRPDLVVLPEYYAVRPGTDSPGRSFVDFDRNLDALRALAVQCNCVLVGGTVVEKEARDMFNTCFVYDRRITAGFYRKVRVTERERALGISPGSGYRILDVGGYRLGLLVCADALDTAAFEAMRGADIIAIPTSSPYRADDTREAKEKRDQDIYVAGAKIASAFVVKTCAATSLLGSQLQGRSLVAAPWGVLARIPVEEEAGEGRLLVDVSLEDLGRHRHGAPS